MLARQFGRLGRVVSNPRRLRRTVRVSAKLGMLAVRNLLSRSSVIGDGDAVVNMTTYGRRIPTTFYALESIAAGSVRPRRLILWLDDEKALAHLPRPLRRLRRRGLEILRTDDFGPHKKQYAFALLQDRSGLPLVAADDDILYDRAWLAGLIASHEHDPTSIWGYRGRRLGVEMGRVSPYEGWSLCHDSTSSYAVMCTGVSGIIYPAGLIDRLRDEGERFRDVAPSADDIWVHSVAVRHGFRSGQVDGHPREYDSIPDTQVESLFQQNVDDGANDLAASSAYGSAQVGRIRVDLAERRSSHPS